jgi:hypothetical protein
LALALWDGSRSERNGQKAFSQWQEMSLGAPVAAVAPTAEAPKVPTEAEEGGGSVLAPVLGGVLGAAALAVAAVIGLRMRRSRQRREQ